MKQLFVRSLIAACTVFLANSVRAEVTSSAAAGFQIRIIRQVATEPQRVYAAIMEIGQWWSPAHTYSGDAKNLSLDQEKGWFQESLPGGGLVRHLDIVFQDPGKVLRMTGGLGPLQGMGLSGALTFTMTPQSGQTQIELTYNVSGYAPDGLAAVAPLVDGVLTEQLQRLCQFCDSGAFDPAGGAEATSSAGSKQP